jgi:hypothetical protein
MSSARWHVRKVPEAEVTGAISYAAILPLHRRLGAVSFCSLLESSVEAALLLALECRDPTVQLPKLYVVAINELLGLLSRRLLVSANDVDATLDMPVLAQNVGAVFLHGPSPCKVLAEDKNAKASVRFRTRGPILVMDGECSQ